MIKLANPVLASEDGNNRGSRFDFGVEPRTSRVRGRGQQRRRGDFGATPPTPAPSPSPSPSPSPTPAPIGGDIGLISMGAPMIAALSFDTNASGTLGDVGDGTSSTNLFGRFGPGVTDQLSASPTRVNDYNSFTSAIGTSSLTGFRYSLLSTATGVRVISPLTALISPLENDTVITRLGLTLTGRELSGYDAYSGIESTNAAERSRARAVTALNLKSLAFFGFMTTDKGSETSAFRIHPFIEPLNSLSRSAPLDLNAPAQWDALLGNHPFVASTTANHRAAAAGLLARFGQAVDQYLTTQRSVADIEYGLRILILPEIEALIANRRSDAEIARINAIDVATISAAFRDFAAIPLIPAAADRLMAVADYREVTLSAELAAGSPTGLGLTANDGFVSPFTIFDSDDLRIDSARVPTQFSGVVVVEAAASGALQVRRLVRTRQVVWIEYDIVAPNGARATGRAYLLFPSLD